MSNYCLLYSVLKHWPFVHIIVSVVNPASGPHDVRHFLQEQSVVSLNGRQPFFFKLRLKYQVFTTVVVFIKIIPFNQSVPFYFKTINTRAKQSINCTGKTRGVEYIREYDVCLWCKQIKLFHGFDTGLLQLMNRMKHEMVLCMKGREKLPMKERKHVWSSCSISRHLEVYMGI